MYRIASSKVGLKNINKLIINVNKTRLFSNNNKNNLPSEYENKRIVDILAKLSLAVAGVYFGSRLIAVSALPAASKTPIGPILVPLLGVGGIYLYNNPHLFNKRLVAPLLFILFATIPADIFYHDYEARRVRKVIGKAKDEIIFQEFQKLNFQEIPVEKSSKPIIKSINFNKKIVELEFVHVVSSERLKVEVTCERPNFFKEYEINDVDIYRNDHLLKEIKL